MGDKASHAHRITGAASIIGAATVLSRVLGFIRDAVIAYVFGAGMFSDAFFVAFRISNMLRRLVGEGALTSSFIPIFTEELGVRGKEGVKPLSDSVFTLFAVILTVLAVIGMIFSKELVSLMSPGFTDDPEKFGLTVKLTAYMFPYMVFIGLMAIAMGVLNSFKHFTAPALAPVLFNVSMILCVILISPLLKIPAYALAIGVLLGGVLQFLLQMPYLKRYGMPIRPRWSFSDPAIKKIFMLMGPAAFGVGVYQLNIFVTLWFASKLAEGSVSYLYYAGRIMELPIGVFSVAVATAVLPSLSEHVAKKEWGEFRGSLSFALRMVNFVTIPATMGMIVLSYPIIDVLFRRGEFRSGAAEATATALVYYAVGLVPVSSCRLLSSVFYSLKDTVTPVWIAFVSFIFNAVFCFVLVGPMKHDGLALATSIASFINMFALFAMLRYKFGRFGAKNIIVSAVKSSVASVLTGAVIYLALTRISYAGMHTVSKTAFIASAVGIGIGAYLVLSKVFRAQELMFLKDFFSKRRLEKG